MAPLHDNTAQPASPTGTPTGLLASFLSACGGEQKRSGSEHVFRCPCRDNHANGDATPSGNVRLGDDGRLLVACRAGCSTESMVAAIGWSMANLMAAPTKAAPPQSRRNAKTIYSSLAEIAATAARLKKGKCESTHTYHDADGVAVLAVVRVRLADGKKEIPQVRPESGGWVFGGIGKNRPLYNLPEILAATDQAICVLEGEQKADLMTKLGFVATTTSQGAGKAKLTDFAAFKGRILHLFADNDAPGRSHMEDVAQRAHAAGAIAVFNVELSGLPPKGDVVDFYNANQKDGLNDEQIADAIRDAVAKAPELYKPAESTADVDNNDDGTDDDEDAGDSARSLADQIVVMASDAELFHTEQGEVYATFAVKDHRETCRIGSSQFSRWLASRFYQEQKQAVPAQAMATAIAQLTAMAHFDRECLTVHSRIARTANAVWIDLCNEKWQAVEITSKGWRVVDEPPVRFVRRSGMKAMALPIAGLQTFDPLFDLLHVDDLSTRLLVTAWLINSALQLTSYPVLGVTGEQGSGKSTFCRALQRLVDPHQVEGRSPPRNEEDIAVAAQHAHVLVYENLSSISPQLSDAMCRVATGAGFAARKLFTDDDERQLAFCRPLIINGIGDLATKSDLADRVVSVHLEPIPRDRRQTERLLWEKYEVLLPQLTGALFSLIAKVIGMPDLDVPLERMAEYSQIGAKVAVALGLPAAEFTDAYRQNRDSSSLTALESSAIGTPLLKLVRENTISCPIGSLLFELQRVADKYEIRHPEWPRTPRALGNELRRLSPNLVRIGISVVFPPRRKDGCWVRVEPAGGTDVHHVHQVHRDDSSA